MFYYERIVTQLRIAALNSDGLNPVFQRHLLLSTPISIDEEKFHPQLFNYKKSLHLINSQ